MREEESIKHDSRHSNTFDDRRRIRLSKIKNYVVYNGLGMEEVAVTGEGLNETTSRIEEAKLLIDLMLHNDDESMFKDTLVQVCKFAANTRNGAFRQSVIDFLVKYNSEKNNEFLKLVNSNLDTDSII